VPVEQVLVAVLFANPGPVRLLMVLCLGHREQAQHEVPYLLRKLHQHQLGVMIEESVLGDQGTVMSPELL